MTLNATEPVPSAPSDPTPPAASVVPGEAARAPSGVEESNEPLEDPVGNDQFVWWGT
jgi:hypothetical protein